MRLERRATLQQVHDATGIFIPHLSEIERGIRKPDRPQLVALSNFYEVDPDEWIELLVHPAPIVGEMILRAAERGAHMMSDDGTA